MAWSLRTCFDSMTGFGTEFTCTEVTACADLTASLTSAQSHKPTTSPERRRPDVSVATSARMTLIVITPANANTPVFRPAQSKVVREGESQRLGLSLWRQRNSMPRQEKMRICSTQSPLTRVLWSPREPEICALGWRMASTHVSLAWSLNLPICSRI